MANELSARDIERANQVFDVYDFIGNETIDAKNLGDALRALNLNPTLAFIEKLGGTKKKGEKTLKINEFLALFKEAKANKDVGNFDDFMECLKLYDKQDDGKMLAAELQHILMAIGGNERLDELECAHILKDCMEAEDEDGFTPYLPFVKKFMS
ncbi:myosin light chain 1-like [Homalodisca vitripennis]|uniref:Myosin light chain alkali n=1 Tax=Homalodisca liturata TaxID=320908 RepID=A0A1B6JXK5_9HEMI|nr:myosin light chain 1-like [Homalodisca vitripennis]